MFHVVCKHGFTENQTGTTPIPSQDMGHTIDFLDIHIYDPVDRLEDRPRSSSQPNPAKAHLLRSQVSHTKIG
jgi:hypothetical protein